MRKLKKWLKMRKLIRKLIKRKESVDVRNQADTLIHSTEKNLKEHGSKISDAEKKVIEDASTAVKEALKGEDIEDIKKKLKL